MHLSATKDRCAARLLERAAALGAGTGERADPATDAVAVMTVRTVHLRELCFSTIVQSEIVDAGREMYRVRSAVDRPALDRASALTTPSLPPGYFLASAGMLIATPDLFAALTTNGNVNSSRTTTLTDAIDLLARNSHRVYCTPVAGQAIDLRLPYGLLEAQLGLGLAGIHRAELCEMIARTLAEQAKN